ncbi:9677_t:CDS:2 [Funneliformis geosporum]|nr:9677_t:CDS:2 [Funneliformis geosporum]
MSEFLKQVAEVRIKYEAETAVELRTKEILNEKPMIKYRPPFLNGLELDAFFQKHRIALEV